MNVTQSKTNTFSSFISSGALVYLSFIIVIIFAIVAICIYLFKTSPSLTNNKKNLDYFNPFDVIKNSERKTNKIERLNMETEKTAHKYDSSLTLLQPSTQHISQFKSNLNKDTIEDMEGDTRSEYSITDVERMKYVKQWIDQHGYASFSQN